MSQTGGRVATARGEPLSSLPALTGTPGGAMADGGPDDRAVGYEAGEHRGFLWVEAPR